MGIFDFFRKKTDVEEYCEKREKEKKNMKQGEFSGYIEIKDNNENGIPSDRNPLNKAGIGEILRGNYNKVEKIKQIRILTGMSLKDSKELVERGERGIFPDEGAYAVKEPENNNLSLEELLHSDISKIEKIKRVRELTGLSLKDAIELVEKYEK